MKKCYTCRKIMDESCFNKNKGRKDGINSVCRECSRKRSRQYYSENKEKHKRVVKENKKEYRLLLKKWLDDTIRSKGCSCCEEKAICCLDFHHLEDKEEVVSRLIGNLSVRRLEMEINKCVILCSNCHRKIHNGLIKFPLDKRLKEVKIPKMSVMRE